MHHAYITLVLLLTGVFHLPSSSLMLFSLTIPYSKIRVCTQIVGYFEILNSALRAKLPEKAPAECN